LSAPIGGEMKTKFSLQRAMLFIAFAATNAREVEVVGNWKMISR
jgi:hypothetical protein